MSGKMPCLGRYEPSTRRTTWLFLRAKCQEIKLSEARHTGAPPLGAQHERVPISLTRPTGRGRNRAETKAPGWAAGR